MEVEGNVGKVGSIEIVDELSESVRDGSLSSMLLRQIDDGLMRSALCDPRVLTIGP